MIVQLVNRTIRKPEELLEDILVKVKDLIIPIDFYVLNMSHESNLECPIIFGRPFLRMNTVINMKYGSITMEVGNNVITFNVYKAMRHPFKDYSLLGLSTIDVYIE